MVYILNMFHLFLMVLLFSSVFSSKSSKKGNCSTKNTYNLSCTPSIFVGNPQREIKLDRYLYSNDVKNLMIEFRQNYSQIVEPIVIGNVGYGATLNERIWAFRVSRGVKDKRKLLKPMLKFVANINGDETVGYALMTSLIQYLVYSDGVDERITTMLNTTDIWIVPSLNPDRLFSYEPYINTLDVKYIPEYSSNKVNVELDQDFPDRLLKDTWPYQRETESMMDFIKKYPFVLSGNFQGGAIVARYPFDNADSFEEHGVVSLTSDNEIFVKLAKDYAQLNVMMAPGNACGKSFPDGITNGNYWYKKSGSMQDANYLLSNCFEITLHLSCGKWARPSDLPMYWDVNLPSMLNFIESIHQGILGLVKDKEDKPVKGAFVEVNGKEKYVRTTSDGEYWRLLVPGSYNVTVRAPPTFLEETKPVVVTGKEPVQLDFVLTRQSVYGTVVNHDNRNPVKEATMKAFQVEGGRYVGGEININVHDGKFGKNLHPGKYHLIASAPGCLGKNRTVTVTKLKSVELDFHLIRLGAFGYVKDRNGKPIPEAVIMALMKEEKNNGTELLFSSTDPYFLSKIHRMVAKTRPNENGEYWLRLNEGNYTLLVAAPASYHELGDVKLTKPFPYARGDFCIQFRSGNQVVFGSLLDKERRPVKGAVVRIIGGDEEDIVLKPDASGNFVRRLFKGGYHITASAPGYKSEMRRLKIDSESFVKHDFTLKNKYRKILFNCFN